MLFRSVSQSRYVLLNLLTGGITIPGVTVITAAIISYLSTSMQVSNAKCSDTVTPRMQIDWDNALMSLRDSAQLSEMEVADGYVKAYKGAGVQRRYARLTQEALDFVDAPDTTPPSSEVLQGRIGRLGVGSTILMDGDITAQITEPWGEASVIKAASVVSPAYIQLNTGELRIAYSRGSDDYIVERVWSGTSWGSETVINAAPSSSPAYIQLNTGELRIAYCKNSGRSIVERVWSGTAWGSETVINFAPSSYPSDIKLS